MRALLASFVPAADEVSFLQRVAGPEGELFRTVAEQGHYAGRVRPTNTRQGIYATTPSGHLLASINTVDPRAMEAMLRRALAAWDALPAAERARAPAGADAAGDRVRPEDRFPEGGTAFEVITRDLPRQGDDREKGDWRARAWNRDTGWLRPADARSLVPVVLEAGATRTVPAALVTRLARAHLVDFVRGQTVPFPADAITHAELIATVVSVADERVRVRLEGRTVAHQRGRWPVAGFDDMHSPSAQERGMDARWLGTAIWNRATNRFEALEVVVVATRTGATQYNGRRGDHGPSPVGFVLRLDPADTARHVAPAHLWAYGW